LPPRIYDVVVKALRDEDKVGKAEVDGQGDDSWNQSGPGSADKVCNVPDEPHEKEKE